MKVLVINCGSSSIKYQLYDAQAEQVLAEGVVARIREGGSYLRHKAKGKTWQFDVPVPSHREGFELIIQSLLDREYGVLQDISEVSAVGHRTVHGGDTFVESTVIDESVIEKLEECIPLAPLHNPPNLLGIREAKRLLPHIPHVAVFDTSFHQTMPPKAYLYALPYEYYENFKIRRYGFHGTSCRYVSRKAADEILKRPLEQLKLIICHLGNGVTVSAVDRGRSVDTSMGFTPLEGLVMGTRSGDIDPGVVFYLHRQLGLSIDRIDDLLNKESGLLGLSGVSNDMRVVIEQAEGGNERCRLAIEVYTYRIKKYIGAYSAVLGGLDALIFTAGIGENSWKIRAMVCEGLEHLGIEMDDEKNREAIGIPSLISKDCSKVAVLVVPTNEERMIVQDTIRLTKAMVEESR